MRVESRQPDPTQVDANAPSEQTPLRAKEESEAPLCMHVFKQIGPTAGGGHASAKLVATMRLRIERVQGGVEFVCRKATALIVVSASTDKLLMMREEASEVGLTQSEHLSVVVLKL